MPTETLYISGQGDECNIQAEGGCSVCPNHYTCVDESPGHDSDTTWIQGTVVGWFRDLYAVDNHSVGEGAINWVRVYAVIKTPSGPASYGKLSIKSGGVAADSTAKALIITYTTVYEEWATPPEGGSWTWAKIDALQAGVTLYSAGEKAAKARCTQVYVVVDYTPVVAPTVTAQAASSVEATTATTNGNITNNGGENCDKRGVVYDTSTHADPGNVAPGASGYANFAEDTDSFGTGAFTKAISGLPSGTTIYYRMYAHNSAGYDYSNTEITFLTKPAAPTNVQATDGDHTDKVVITWIKATGATGYQVYRDGTPLGWLGDVATHNDAGAGAPSITPGNAVAGDGGSTAHVALSIAGEGTNNGTNHTYKVKARNGTGESVDSGTNTGYRAPGALTYQWQRSAADSDAAYSNIAGTTEAYNDTTAPAPTVTPGTASASDGDSTAHVTLSLAGESANIGAGRFYRCVLNASGCTQQITGVNRGYRGVGALTRQWYRSAGDSDASYSVLGGATTDPYNDTTAPAPTVTPGTASASDGDSTAHVTLSLAGESANIGAGRWYKCLVSATGAAPQYSTANRGYRGVGALTRQWYRSAGDSDASYSVLGGATTDPYNDTTAPAPTITPGAGDASDGTSSVYVTLSLAGESANIGAGRWYKCLVSATGAAPQYSTANRGYRGVGALTLQWQRSAGDSDAAYSNIGGATTDPYNDTGAPGNGQGRYYQCVESATGATPQTSSSDRGYRWMGEKTAHMGAKLI